MQKAVLVLILACHALYAWPSFGLAPGSTTLKYLKTATTARQAALAGSGMGLAQSTDVSWHPLAATFDSIAQVSLNQRIYSQHIGASLSQVSWSQPLGAWRIFAGGDFLQWDKLQGRDEFGHSTGEFGAGTWSVRGGLAHRSATGWRQGLNIRYAQQQIAEFVSHAFLVDLAWGYQLAQRLYFSAGAFNWGWVGEFDKASETPPAELKAGLSYRTHYRAFSSTVHLDLQRYVDEDPRLNSGLEIAWQQFIYLRLGAALGNHKNLYGTGLGLRTQQFSLDYSYETNSHTAANHSFSLAVFF